MRDVYKEPITDIGKQSKKGRLDLVRFVGSHGSTLCTTKLNANAVADANSVMRTVFENGCIIVDDTFDAIRNRTR